MKNYSVITRCRACGSSDLKKVIDLGEMCLSGNFPKSTEEELVKGPIELVLCGNKEECGLLQLRQTYNLEELYGRDYGYKSALNKSMVQHLKSKVENILKLGLLADGDIILDIGSNDGTTLNSYPNNNYKLLGVDPSAEQLKKSYNKNIDLIVDFFSSKKFKNHFDDNSKAKVITSYSMFYDLEDPVSFSKEVSNILHPEGIWNLEQSYLPRMLSMNSFDTICHEHLEYYGLRQISFILNKAGLSIISYEFNEVNGGSISIIAGHTSSRLVTEADSQENPDISEASNRITDIETYSKFQHNIEESRDSIIDLLISLKKESMNVYGLGASTKGNTLLQYCKIGTDLIAGIGEINKDKIGCFTPGTNIPIVSEEEAIQNSDYLLILPWHFKKSFVENKKYKGKTLIFPLPTIDLIAI